MVDIQFIIFAYRSNIPVCTTFSYFDSHKVSFNIKNMSTTEDFYVLELRKEVSVHIGNTTSQVSDYVFDGTVSKTRQTN